MEYKEVVNILLADDHQLMIDGIKGMLGNSPDYVIAAEVNNGQAAYEMIVANPGRFQLLLTDISMPLLTGTELCKMIKNQFPHIQVLILSMYNNTTAVKQAVLAEADGYILKNAGRDELLHALHRVTGGGTYFSQEILPIIYNQYHKEKRQDEQLMQLSQREKEILSLVVKEFTSDEIARKLFISKKTVENHRRSILEKTNCKSTVGLVKLVVRLGME